MCVVQQVALDIDGIHMTHTPSPCVCWGQQVNDYELKQWARASGVAFTTVEELCRDPAAAKMVTADLNAIGKVCAYVPPPRRRTSLPWCTPFFIFFFSASGARGGGGGGGGWWVGADGMRAMLRHAFASPCLPPCLPHPLVVPHAHTDRASWA